MAENEDQKRGQRFYEVLSELETIFPEGDLERLKELKEIYNETKSVVSQIVAGISDVVHSKYTLDLFNLEDFDMVREIEKGRIKERETDTTLI